MILNAQIAAASTWCVAARCGNDAEPSGLCAHHERLQAAGQPIQLHHTQQPRTADQDAELYCTTCQTWKPDNNFSRKTARTERRQRSNECKPCSNQRRRATRNPKPCQALTTHPDNTGRVGRPCRSHAKPGTNYCSSHQGHS